MFRFSNVFSKSHPLNYHSNSVTNVPFRARTNGDPFQSPPVVISRRGTRPRTRRSPTAPAWRPPFSRTPTISIGFRPSPPETRLCSAPSASRTRPPPPPPGSARTARPWPILRGRTSAATSRHRMTMIWSGKRTKMPIHSSKSPSPNLTRSGRACLHTWFTGKEMNATFWATIF